MPVMVVDHDLSPKAPLSKSSSQYVQVEKMLRIRSPVMPPRWEGGSGLMEADVLLQCLLH